MLIDHIDELTCEKFCRNCAFAFKLPGLFFYESKNWIAIDFDFMRIATVERNGPAAQVKWHTLLMNAIRELCALQTQYCHSETFKDFDPSLEFAILRLDLAGKRQTKKKENEAVQLGKA